MKVGTIAMILAGGAGTRLDILSKHRAKPAVPFGGKYRIIDFALSNCVNSGIYHISVLTQYLPRSLNEHIGIGRPWDLDRKIGGIELLPPYQGKEGDWYNGTAHAVFQNMEYFVEKKCDNVLLLSGDHIYKMNYSEMIRQHNESGADLTIAVKPVDLEIASEFGILSADENLKITEFEEKPENPKSNLASMGIYIFKSDVLKDILIEYCGEKGLYDFGKDIIPNMINTHKVFAYRFEEYWRDVGTLEEYWKSNIELTEKMPPIDMYEEDNPVYTKHLEVPPAKFGDNGSMKKSIISGGCIIDGHVENSVLSPGVIIEEGAVVKNSIIFNKAVIKKGSMVDRTVIDKEVTIGENCIIGFGDDLTVNKEVPKRVYSGLNLIGKFAVIPDNTVIERNCRVMSHVDESDFTDKHIHSGETVHSRIDENPYGKYR